MAIFGEKFNIAEHKQGKLLEKIQSLGISLNDIEEKFCLGRGKGGQKINKTANCVILKHLPTKTIVRCQRERERSKNRFLALRMLVDELEFQLKGSLSERGQRLAHLKKQKSCRDRKSKKKLRGGRDEKHDDPI